jgi:hypothetical protein
VPVMMSSAAVPSKTFLGVRRIQTGESCAQFMVRELEGGRRTLLAMRWGFLLVMPSLLMLGEALLRSGPVIYTSTQRCGDTYS